MTTKKQIKEFTAPLLAGNPDLVLVDSQVRLVVMKPVHHFMRGIIIDRTSSAYLCRPQWFVTYLFAKRDHLTIEGGGALYRGRGRLWLHADPLSSIDLVEQAEKIALPKMRALATLEDYCRHALPDNPNLLPYQRGIRVLAGLALGHLGEVKRLFDAHPGVWGLKILNDEGDGLGDLIQARGDELAPADRLRLAALLHDWEAYSVARLKLQSVWERTPFPLELGLPRAA